MQIMAEFSGEGKYIKCSKCKCKYINDEEHIKQDFGYHRLNVRYKCCMKCRGVKLVIVSDESRRAMWEEMQQKIKTYKIEK